MAVPAHAKAEFDVNGFTVLRGCYPAGLMRSLRPPAMDSASAAALLADTELSKRVCFAHPVGNADASASPSSSPSSRVPNKLEQCSMLPGGFGRLWSDLACNGGLREAAESLLGGPAVILKDKYVFKQRGGPGFTPHQDLAYGWHRLARRAVTAHIAFDEAGPGNSALQVVRGCHSGGLVLGPDGPERELPGGFVASLPFEYVRLCPGDVLWFDALVPHRSDANTSDSPRAVYYVSFAAVSDLLPRLRPHPALPAEALAVRTEHAEPGGDVAKAPTGAGAGSLEAYSAYYDYYWRWTGDEGGFAADWAGTDGSLVSLAPVADADARAAMAARAWELFRAHGEPIDLVPGCKAPA